MFLTVIGAITNLHMMMMMMMMLNGAISSDLELTPNSDFEDTPLFDVDYLRNGTGR